MEAIFPLTYLGPVSIFANLLQYDKVLIEKKEHFIKQSYRNRCEIVGASGKLSLSIPTFRKGRDKRIIDEVGICNDESWKTVHWRSICTAYRSSPYFEYYEADFEGLFLQESTNLFEFNLALFELILKKLKMEVQFSFTSEFILNYEIDDYRPFYARNSEEQLVFPRYIQVFEERVGFQPNLSVLDLLFNEGPASKDYLLKVLAQNGKSKDAN